MCPWFLLKKKAEISRQNIWALIQNSTGYYLKFAWAGERFLLVSRAGRSRLEAIDDSKPEL